MKILLAGEIADWKTLEPSRWNQPYRNQMAQALQLIANSIANNGASEGAVMGLRWRLEPAPIEKSAENEVA